ncbi:translation initiation factor IF-3 [bacterium]|nr:translation initiation factor IF-3 [bacterium]
MNRDFIRVNEKIRVPEVRLIDYDGKQVGIVKTDEARQIAMSRKLDLVEVASEAKPPVCRIMDFGKYRYEQTKREKQAKKKQQSIKIKEIKIRPGIDNHDYMVKINHLTEFLEKGCKVKITLMYRGREMSHKEMGRSLIDRLVEDVKGRGAVEMKPKEMGRFVTMVIGPTKTS